MGWQTTSVAPSGDLTWSVQPKAVLGSGIVPATLWAGAGGPADDSAPVVIEWAVCAFVLGGDNPSLERKALSEPPIIQYHVRIDAENHIGDSPWKNGSGKQMWGLNGRLMRTEGNIGMRAVMGKKKAIRKIMSLIAEDIADEKDSNANSLDCGPYGEHHM